MNSLPAAALGHFVMEGANLGVSSQFYVDSVFAALTARDGCVSATFTTRIRHR